MTDRTQLYIDGTWSDGASQIENCNPSDGVVTLTGLRLLNY